VATVSSLVWEGVDIRFADIDRESFCIDLNSVEDITKKRKRY
jgi:Predicted pyridoxal phosphate-dependent enzyme apparently involved in regulation of cell wall biogenesis